MSDDYLYDGTGEPDPEVVRLEQMLGRLRSAGMQPPVPVRVTTVAKAMVVRRSFMRRRKPDTTESFAATEPFTAPVRSVRLQADRGLYLGVRFLAPAIAAAATVVLMVGAAWKNAAPASISDRARKDKASWEVSVVIGTPRVGASALVGEGRIAVGQTLTTDEGSRATMEVGDIGRVTLDERTRVRLLETRDGHHRLALERGTLHAAIAAPPGQFVVTTPTATATDLGCIYSLHVNDDGSGLLSVEAGWVAFEERGRESFVPAGASSRTDRVSGPGTPRYDDTEQAFRDAVDQVDSGSGARGAAALPFILAHARGRDAMTLWHLIPRVGAGERGAVVDALTARVPMPAAVTREAVLRLDRAALDQWWDLLGLNEAAWWRKWKQPLAGAPSPQLTETAAIKDTVRITVSGPGISRALEIKAPQLMVLSNVYAGAFIGAPAAEPDAAWPRYTVTFDIQTRDGVKAGAYTVDYAVHRGTGEGFIHLPGPGDARYRVNIGTILRTSQDGAWHQASTAWSQLLNQHLP